MGTDVGVATHTGVAVKGRRVASAEVAGYRVTDATYGGGQSLGRHTHPRATLSLVCRGGFRETSRRGVSVCTAGMIHVRPAEEPHANDIDPQGSRLLIVEPPVETTVGDRRIRRLLGRITLVRDGGARAIARQLQWELHHRDQASDLALEGLVLALLARLLRATSLGEQPRQSATTRLERAREFIDANFALALSLSDIAAIADLHPSSLARAFKRRYEMTPWEYQRRRQIAWVKAELLRGDRPIAALAHEAGFADHSHLTRAFQAAEGMPPSEVRRQR